MSVLGDFKANKQLLNKYIVALNQDERADLYGTLCPDNRLRDFFYFAWFVNEPGTNYIHGWHIDAICEHLEAVSRGDIRRLVINIPPRHAKSNIVSVAWQAWEWTFKPTTKWLTASYAGDLANRDTMKVRSLIQGKWYQKLWGDKVQLTVELQDKLQNTVMGHRIATSVGGGSTGEGGDRIVVDDPHKIEESESETMRQNTIRWWSETMSGRVNSPEKSAKVIVMQRIHFDDLTGYVLGQKDQEYVSLSLPTEYVPTNYVTPIGWRDPRKHDGELMWPSRFTRKAIEGLKRDLGPYAFASQHQQTPIPRGGGKFKSEWFKFTEIPPLPSEIIKVVRYWDKAGTSKGGAYTCGVLMVVDRFKRIYVIDVIREQLADQEREALIKSTAEKDRRMYPQVVIWIEQEPGSGGKDSALNTIRNLVGYTVFAERPSGDKETRAGPFASQCAAGAVYLLKADWNGGYITELTLFPRYKYKDQVDASSAAFNRLFDRGMATNTRKS